jgi:hypothetical protein
MDGRVVVEQGIAAEALENSQHQPTQAFLSSFLWAGKASRTRLGRSPRFLRPGWRCPLRADPFQTAQIDVGGLARTHGVHVPAGVEHLSGFVINMHAAGATGPDQAALMRYDAVADAHGGSAW